MDTNITNALNARLDTPIAEASDKQILYALMQYVNESATQRIPSSSVKKKLYYISAEFLIGKLLSNNLINLGLYDEVKSVLEQNGKSLAAVEEAELEPSLGNGGLGRLAACYIDGMATLGLNGDGVGLNYHYGLFKQVFSHRKQTETVNPWIEDDSWLIKTDFNFTVKFKSFTVDACMFDLLVTGYDNRTNKLHLFDVTTVDECIVKKGIDFDKTDIEKNLTLFLYPDDSDEAGHKLRIYQQYFMVSCGAQLIVKEAQQRGCNLYDLADYVVIQINDTHPSMIIPELVRVLTEAGVEFDAAANIVSECCAYTNHTILAEALEKWPLKYFEDIVPQLVPIIKRLSDKVRERFDDPSVQIIDGNDTVHMAHMDIHYGYSINGVAALHSDILRESELAHFARIYPEKFRNVTNGVTFRRWLMHCNPRLTALIEQKIGDGFKKDATQLSYLKGCDDSETLQALLQIKSANKAELCSYLKATQNIKMNPDAIFDVQIKRLHEYKRQQMNALYIIHKYLEIKAGKLPVRPITFIFGAKAAPAYKAAKDIIHLLLCLSKLIKNDKAVAPHLQVVMVENYNVTLAEKLIPACDISEQISLASKEASGTGNMKLMLNGAVTLGTADGANVEIAELVGQDNIYMFGRSSDFVIELYEAQCYSSAKVMEHKPHIAKLVEFVASDKLCDIGDKKTLKRLYKNLSGHDWFMAMLDIEEYIAVKDRVLADYEDREQFAKKMLANIAGAGFFSSDRSIADYNERIWRL